MNGIDNGFRYDAERGLYLLGEKKIDRVSDILKSVGIYKPPPLSDERMAFYWERGSAVHKACELIDLGKLDESSIVPEIAGYVAAYKSFLKFMGVRYQPGFIEKPMYHEELVFAGTPDRICRLDMVWAVLDIKTSQQQNPATRIQTAAYGLLAEANIPQVSKIESRFELTLGKDGVYAMSDDFGPTWEDSEIFVNALAVVKWKNDWGIEN